MSNYQILYRHDVAYPYLAILEDDSLSSQTTAPNELYAFHEQTDREVMMENHIPKIVNNIHGSDVYQNYLDLGWIDISHAKDLLPLSIQMWLTQKSS